MRHSRVSLARGLFGKLLLYSLKAFQSLLILPWDHFQFRGIVSFSYRINQSVVSFSQSSWLPVWREATEECCFRRKLLSAQGLGWIEGIPYITHYYILIRRSFKAWMRTIGCFGLPVVYSVSQVFHLLFMHWQWYYYYFQKEHSKHEWLKWRISHLMIVVLSEEGRLKKAAPVNKKASSRVYTWIDGSFFPKPAPHSLSTRMRNPWK